MSKVNIPKLLSEAVLHIDARSGSFRDMSPVGSVVTPTDVYLTGDGVRFPRSTSELLVPNSADINLTEFTCVALCESGIMSQITTEQLFVKRDGGGTNFDFYIQDSGIKVYDGSSVSTLLESAIGYKYLAASGVSGEVPQFWGNGQNIGAGDNALSVTENDAPLTLFNYYSGNSPFKSTASVAVLFPRKLTATEHAALYGYLSDLQWPTQTDYVSSASLEVDPDEPGLVAGYNMRPVGGKLVDVSPEGNDGTIEGRPVHGVGPMGDFMWFDGTRSSCLSSPVLGSYAGFSISTWIKSSDVVTPSQPVSIFKNTSNGWGARIASGNLTIFDDIANANANYYTTPITPDLWHHVELTIDGTNENRLYLNGVLVGSGTVSSASFSTLVDSYTVIGSRDINNDFFNGSIGSTKFYNYARTDQQIAKEYNRGKTALWSTDYGVHESVEARSEVLENSPFKIYDGTWEISNDGGLKAIHNVTAGTCYVKSSAMGQTKTEAAYGRWRFRLTRTGTNVIRTMPIATLPGPNSVVGQDGYLLGAYSDGTLRLFRITAASGTELFRSAQGIASDGVPVDVQLVRKSKGEFSVYANGALLSAVIGTNPVTDNTHTESNMWNLHKSPGDRIAYADADGNHTITKRILS